MKDTVILLINDYKVFVGDFYQDKIKQVKFKKQDYWEVFDTSDLKEFLEYMIYPLNYKKFEGSHLRIYFNKPLMYSYLYDVQDSFRLAESIQVQSLDQLMRDTMSIHEDYQAGMVFECLEKRYSLDEQGTLVEVEDQEAQISVSVEHLCEYIIAQEEKKQAITSAFEYYVWFSPVTLIDNVGTKEKYKYLEVESKLIEMILDGAYVGKNGPLMTYEQVIYKLFGKKEIRTCYQKAPQGGKFFQVSSVEDTRIVKKDQVLGVIAPVTEEREKAIDWLKNTIKY